MKNIEAVFIDRDGTIGGTGNFIHPDDFKPYPFALEAIKLLKDEGLKVFAFTNQHRISKGQVTIEAFEKEFQSYGMDDVYICPHDMQGNCLCHKPKPGMLLQASKDHQLNLQHCVVIGDVGTDMMAADAVNAKKILVKTGWGQSSLKAYRHIWSEIEPDYIANDLLQAVQWLVSHEEE